MSTVHATSRAKLTVGRIFVGTEMMTRVETIEQCQREAVRLRAILSKATTPAIKLRLIQRIEEFERVVRGEAEAPELERVS